MIHQGHPGSCGCVRLRDIDPSMGAADAGVCRHRDVDSLAASNAVRLARQKGVGDLCGGENSFDLVLDQLSFSL